ncbi:uncharacterized protein [Rutidosis leptorrhynchoides]|uniref:uncharacterized protein n=1 Tax=Rutidosis leptorrhynchoides TaxID=125765 RepID=UPI003A9A3963
MHDIHRSQEPTTHLELKSTQHESTSWVELLNDYDYEIRYHPRMANVVIDALSRKERVKPLRVRALNMVVDTNLTSRILGAQLEELKKVNVRDESIKGLDKQFEVKGDETRYFIERIWVQKFGGLRKLVLDEQHKTRYSIHPDAEKMYHDLKIL